MGIRVELAAEVDRLKKSSSVWFAGLWALFFAAAPIVVEIWNNMPQDFKDALPHGTTRYLAIFAFVTTFLSRIVRVRRTGVKDDGTTT